MLAHQLPKGATVLPRPLGGPGNITLMDEQQPAYVVFLKAVDGFGLRLLKTLVFGTILNGVPGADVVCSQDVRDWPGQPHAVSHSPIPARYQARYDQQASAAPPATTRAQGP